MDVGKVLTAIDSRHVAKGGEASHNVKGVAKAPTIHAADGRAARGVWGCGAWQGEGRAGLEAHELPRTVLHRRLGVGGHGRRQEGDEAESEEALDVGHDSNC